MNTNIADSSTRIFDTGSAGYGLVDLAALEQFEIFDGHFRSAPEIAESIMTFRVRNSNGNLANNEQAINQILGEVDDLIEREMTAEEYRTACVMMAKVKR